MKPRHLVTRPLRMAINAAGFEVVRKTDLIPPHALPHDFSEQDVEDYRAVAPYTLVPPERTFTLTRAVEHVVKQNIPGVLVECGTWRGGCAMTMARALKRCNALDREIWLYDLFADNWPMPTEYDISHGKSALEAVEAGFQTPEESIYTLDEVKANLSQTEFPQDKIRYIMGRIEDTLPGEIPEEIAILRLDTDFYESTRHELVHLYPRLVKGGVLIIDDYGEWQGSRKATDEYIAQENLSLHLIRVDVGARMAIKP